MSLPMEPSCWLACVRGCEGRHPIEDAAKACPRCGGLMDVEHDIDQLRETSADQWKQRFGKRAGIRCGRTSSGVWSKHEWVLPWLDASSIVSLGEGWSPLLDAPGLAEELALDQLWIKQCGISHTGSFKDLGMTVLVSAVRQMIDHGAPIEAMVCASTGDTSAALAAYEIGRAHV